MVDEQFLTNLVTQVGDKLQQLLAELNRIGVLEKFCVTIGKGVEECDELQQTLLKLNQLLTTCVAECQTGQSKTAEIRNVITKLVKKKNSLTEEQEESAETCRLCSKQFETWSSLWKHVRREHKAGAWECTTCGKPFKTHVGYARHQLSHGSSPTYLCDVCGRTCGSLAEWKQHVRSAHSKGEKLQCAECGQRFLTPARLRAHGTSHGPPVVQCEICLEGFATVKLLRLHRLSHATKTHCCAFCEKSFSTETKLESHTNKFHQELSCANCESVFRSKSALKSHVTEAHSGHKQPGVRFECRVEGCGRMFVHERSLKKHTRLKHGEGGGETCGTCHATFQDKYKLERHLLCHAEEQFACDACSKLFARRDGLKRHRDIVHGTERRFACSQCPKTFSVKCNKESHEQSVHGGPGVAVQCEQCGRTCKNTATFRVHLKIHGARALPCGLCTKRFLRKIHLEKHMKTKHGGVSAFQAVLDSATR